MIPKIIHYCWFGGKEKTQEVEKCINTWRKKCPDYEIKEWNENNFDVNYNLYVSQAYAAKKYAFVSDVCRMYVLHTYGGIYLDTDVEVILDFNPYLNQHSFIGEEQNGRLLGTATIGAEANVQWIKDFLSLYDGIPFIRDNGKFDILPNTTRLTIFFQSYKGVKPTIYSLEYFCAKDYKSGKIVTNERTVCIHHYAASWVEPLWFQKYEMLFWKKLGLKNLNICGKFYWKIVKPLQKAVKKLVLNES